MSSGERTVAQLVAEFLVQQGVERIYGLCGGHIQPMWDAVARAGIEVVDVRHEAAAVYMAHAESELTGRPGVALVTAGPGLTNAVTPIANVSVARAPVVVISGRTPRPQAGMGAMQDVPQAEIVSPLCRRVEKVSERHQVVRRLDAVWLAALGCEGPSGPAYIDFPTDLQNEEIHPADVPPAHGARHTVRVRQPGVGDVAAAQQLLSEAQRPLVIAGRSAHFASEELTSFLDATGALYLDTSESRGAIAGDHPAYIPAMRSRAMREADLIVTVGRRLDFQLGYGSRAVFSDETRFLRIGNSLLETSENRRGDVEVHADVGVTLRALIDEGIESQGLDTAWVDGLREENAKRNQQLAESMSNEPAGNDGRMHPYRVLSAVNNLLGRDSIAVADGGDILSFARVGLEPSARYLDCGALGCLGVGVPFATAAAITCPDAPVVAVIGDGSFGFTAMEIDTAVRRRAAVLFIVVNNESWNIERHDMVQRYDSNVVGVDLPNCRYDLLAQGLDAYAERVEDPKHLQAAIERGLNHAPAVLDVCVTQDAVSPDFKSGLASVPSRQALQPWNDSEIAQYT